MKIYSLFYTYHKKKEDGSVVQMFFLTHDVAESLEDVMSDAEKTVEAVKGYQQYSMKLQIKSIIPLTTLLDKIKIKLPDLVKSAKEREQIRAVGEALNKIDN